jgi:hypothetical protein
MLYKVVKQYEEKVNSSKFSSTSAIASSLASMTPSPVPIKPEITKPPLPFPVSQPPQVISTQTPIQTPIHTPVDNAISLDSYLLNDDVVVKEIAKETPFCKVIKPEANVISPKTGGKILKGPIESQGAKVLKGGAEPEVVTPRSGAKILKGPNELETPPKSVAKVVKGSIDSENTPRAGARVQKTQEFEIKKEEPKREGIDFSKVHFFNNPFLFYEYSLTSFVKIFFDFSILFLDLIYMLKQ